MNKIIKTILLVLTFLITPIILTGIFQFFVLIVLGISIGVFIKFLILLLMYLLIGGIFECLLNK